MPKTTDVETPSGIHTRQTTRRMQETAKSTQGTEAAMPKWRFPVSTTEARNL